MNKKVIFILGPTGSGKTALGVKLAKKFNGEIISADSRQVYKKLDIGTGKEGISQKSKIKSHNYNSKLKLIIQGARYIDGIPQYMIDVTKPEERFTLFDWLEEARLILEDIFSRVKVPIVVGGTGLYAKALSEGFELRKSKIQISNVKSNPKSKFQREELDKMPLEQLQKIYHRLQTTDYKLDLRNPRRLIRTIEKAQEGTITTKEKPYFESLILAIDLDRKELYERIDKRVDDRFTTGMLEEVAGLLKSGISADWLRSLGLEYKIISQFIINGGSRLRSNNSLVEVAEKNKFDEMVQELKWKTHAYARRQLTWLRKQKNVIWIKNLRQAGKLVENFLKVI